MLVAAALVLPPAARADGRGGDRGARDRGGRRAAARSSTSCRRCPASSAGATAGSRSSRCCAVASWPGGASTTSPAHARRPRPAPPGVLGARSGLLSCRLLYVVAAGRVARWRWARRCGSPGGSSRRHRPRPGRRRQLADVMRLERPGVAGARGRTRVGAAGPAPARPARRDGLRGARGRARGRRPVQGRDGLQPGHPERNAVQPATPAIRFLQARKPARFAGPAPHAPVSLAVPLMPRTWRCATASYDARGYDYPVELATRSCGSGSSRPTTCNYAFCAKSAGTTPGALKALGVLGVSPPAPAARDPPLRAASARPTTDRRAGVRNPPPCRRRSSSIARSCADGAERRCDAITSPASGRGRRRHREADPGPAPTAAGAARPAAGVARISDYEDGGSRSARDAAPALLVAHRQLVPRLEGDRGRPRRDGPPGRLPHPRRPGAGGGRTASRFRYEPASWRVGWIASASRSC